MLFLKAMSGQDLPDDHPSKHYTIYQIPDSSPLAFGRRDLNPDGTQPDGVRASWFTDDGVMSVDLEGNAYVMNAQGKTIASRSPY